MSAGAPGLDGLLDQLETVIGRLTDPGAPLERLVADYEEAGRLVEAAEGQLAAATARLTPRSGPEAPARD